MRNENFKFQPDTSQNISSILRRRKMKILGIFLILFSISALAIQKIPATYKATAQISFNSSDDRFIETQKHYIKSIMMAQQVAKGLNLLNASNALDTAPTHKFKTLNLGQDNKPEQSTLLKDSALLQKIVDNLSIYHPNNSNILELSYIHQSPKEAKRILGSFVRHYMKSQNKEVLPPIFDDNSYQNQSELRKTLKNLQEKLQNAKKYPASMQNSTNVPMGRVERLQEEQEQYKYLLNYPDEDKRIKPYKDRIKKKVEELNILSLRYGEKHPAIKALKSEISQLEEKVKDIRNLVIKDTMSKMTGVEKQIEDIAKASIKTSNNENTQIEAIEETISQITSLLSKLQENNTYASTKYSQNYTYSNNVKVISPATTTPDPISPNRAKLSLIALIASLLTAAIIVIIIEKNNKTFLTGKQLEAAFKQPCYALLPRVKSDKDKPIANYVIDNIESDIAEAVRNLRLNIKLYSNIKSKTAQVVMLTSSIADEGKTTLSTWLGHLSAKAGERVIIIDTDLREPRLHKALGTDNTLSLVDYLTGSDKLENVIDKNLQSGLHAIYGRSVPASALDLICSNKMDDLIRNLKKDYDLIIIDTPACMAIPDARAVRIYCDLMLYIVSWNKTDREVIHRGLSQFTNLEKPDIATVLTNIDVKKHVQYGYGDVISDYGTYKPV